MKKLFSVLAVLMISFSLSFITASNTFAEDVRVHFKITNLKAETTVSDQINGQKFALGNRVSKVAIRYRNAVRVDVSVLNNNAEILKEESFNTNLSSEIQTVDLDVSDLELGVGEYRVEAIGYNVDNEATEKSTISFTVEAPEIPNTGGFMSDTQKLYAAENTAVIASVVVGIAIIFYVLKLAKGVRK